MYIWLQIDRLVCNASCSAAAFPISFLEALLFRGLFIYHEALFTDDSGLFTFQGAAGRFLRFLLGSDVYLRLYLRQQCSKRVILLKSQYCVKGRDAVSPRVHKVERMSVPIGTYSHITGTQLLHYYSHSPRVLSITSRGEEYGMYLTELSIQRRLGPCENSRRKSGAKIESKRKRKNSSSRWACLTAFDQERSLRCKLVESGIWSSVQLVR